MPCVRAVLNLLIAGGYPVNASVLAQAYHFHVKPKWIPYYGCWPKTVCAITNTAGCYDLYQSGLCA